MAVHVDDAIGAPNRVKVGKTSVEPATLAGSRRRRPVLPHYDLDGTMSDLGETNSIASKKHGRNGSLSSTLRSRLSQMKRSSRSAAEMEQLTQGEQSSGVAQEATPKQTGQRRFSHARKPSSKSIIHSVAEQPSDDEAGQAQRDPTAHTPTTPRASVSKNEKDSLPSVPTPHPLSEELPRISAFFVASSIISIIVTRFVHWAVALAFAATLAYVLNTQLRTSLADRRWDDEEQERRRALRLGDIGSAYQEETVEWMNNVLKTVWPLINQDYFVPLVDLMEDALMQQVPGIVHSCRVEDLDQGTVPLRVKHFRLLDPRESAFIEGNKSTEQTCESNEMTEEQLMDQEEHAYDVGDFVNLEITFAYRSPATRRKKAKSNKAQGVMTEAEREEASNNDVQDGHSGELPLDQIHMLIYMAIGLQKIAAVDVPVWCEVLGIEGKMRLRVQLVPTAPFVGHVAFTFVDQPKLEISAKPLGRRTVIDAMHLPLISSYVLHSVEAVIKNFISPKSYTVDVASLLEVNDGPRNVYSLGVILLLIHQGTNLPAADSNGRSDPFVSVSFARAGRPLFTTRVLLRTVNPIWQEMAVLLVSPDEVRDHEKLRMTIFDADRFSVDDPLGKVEVSVDKLIHRALEQHNNPNEASLFETQTEPLLPMRAGQKTQGSLSYSVGFFRLSKPVDGSRQASKVQLLRQAAGRHLDSPTNSTVQASDKALPLPPETPNSPESTATDINASDRDRNINKYAQYMTGFDRFVHKIGLPLDEDVLQRRKERSERVKKLTTMMEGEEQATFGPPDERWPSGILCFHIHSISGLGFEPPQRSWTNSKRLAPKPQYPADEDPLGEGASKMPNSYVQVLLNDEPVFRTRTKALNPRPFINAGSERWVSDFNSARIDFVVRDARQREGDAILGICPIKLNQCIRKSSRVTQWYTLSGGLGYGKIRISLLWRSCEVQIPPPMRGWNVGVLEVGSCYIGGVSADSKTTFDKREAHMLFETVGGRAETENVVPHWEGETEGAVPSEKDDSPTIGFRWPLNVPVRIAVRQRYPNFLYVHLRSDSRVPGRSYKHAHTVIPLIHLEDGKEVSKRVPIFELADWQQFEQDVLRKTTNEHQLASSSAEDAKMHRFPILEEMVSEAAREHELLAGKESLKMRQGHDNETEGDKSEASSTKSSPSQSSQKNSLKYVGYLDITLVFHPGLAPEHRASLGGDHELRVAYECFQALVDCGLRGKPRMISDARKRKLSMKGASGKDLNENGQGTTNEQQRPSNLRIDTDNVTGKEKAAGSGRPGASQSAYDQDDDDAARIRELADDAPESGHPGDEDYDDDDDDGTVEDDEGLVEADTPEGRRARMRNMHRQHRGAAQIKSFRTLQWIKTNAEDGVGRVKRIASRQQDKRIAKMENEGVSHF